MKYLRTNSSKNIYETKDLIKCEDNRYPNGWFTKNGVPLIATKESDNIEDLCDAYFAISNTDYKTPIKIDFEKKIIHQWQGVELVVTYTFEQFIPYHTIYGAIWTDKGLIYIAKLTEKGWELL